VWTYIRAVERTGLEGSDESEVSSDEGGSSNSFEEGSDGDDDGEGDGGDGGDGDGGGDGKGDDGSGSGKASFYVCFLLFHRSSCNWPIDCICF
jgi:hypothetical protein